MPQYCQPWNFAILALASMPQARNHIPEIPMIGISLLLFLTAAADSRRFGRVPDHLVAALVAQRRTRNIKEPECPASPFLW